MKILLIKPPTNHFKNTAPPVSGIPLGLAYIASSLKATGHNVRIYDAIVNAPEERWDCRESENIICLGATFDEIADVVAEANPDVVGVTSQFTSQVGNVIKIAQTVKKVNQSIKVVVGGPHATVAPDSFFQNDQSVDYVVRGEGEFTMPALLECFSGLRDIESVKGVTYRSGEKIINNEPAGNISDIDVLPLPAYELLDMERYFYFNLKGKDTRERYLYPGSERSVTMITSRGCPFSCIFCSIHLVMGHRFRANSADHVLKHIQLLKDKYRVAHIHFEDDNFSFDISRFNAILDGIISRRLEITWDAPNGVRADYLNESILEKCKNSGCTYLRIGVESANEHVSKNIIRKHLDLKKVTEIAKASNKVGIDLDAFYVIGFPGEKIRQMRETINFAVSQERKYGLFPYMFTATPLLGTRLYEIVRKNGYISKDLLPENFATSTQGEGMIATEDFTPGDIEKLLRNYKIKHGLSRVIFALKYFLFHPSYLFTRIFDAFIKKPHKALLNEGLKAFIRDIFFIRYKNCINRKVGENK
ncbi:MAG: B12-binding domain-containing radical SAM protein [Candidatus Riflebacteria bacterium]|nr:B12-binding domain-containing radical SAM protein [Candidatus Riflebacteria bacterium]